MASSIEILLKAKNDTDAAFKAVVKHLEETGKEAKKTNDILGKMSDDLKGKLGGAVDGLTSKLGPLGSTLTAMGPAGVAAAAGIGAIVGGLTIAAKVAFDAATAAAAYADRLKVLEASTGIGAQSLQALEVAAKLGNTSLETLSNTVGKMLKGLNDSSPAFAKLGLSAKALKDDSPEVALTKVAKAIEAIENPAERAAARIAVFGKSGNELADTLSALAAGAGELGGALSDEALSAAAALADKTDLLKTAWERVQLQFGAAIAQSPELQRGLDELTTALVNMATAIADATPKIISFFDKAVAGVRLAIVAFKEFGSLDYLDKIKLAGQEIAMSAEDAAERAAIAARQLAFEQKHLVEDVVSFTGKGEEAKVKAAEKAAAERAEALAKAAFAERKNFADSQLEHTKVFLAELDRQIAAQKKHTEELRDELQAEVEHRKRAIEASAEMFKILQEARERELEQILQTQDAINMATDLLIQFGLSASSVFVKVLDGWTSGTRAAVEFAKATNLAGKAMAAMNAAASAFNSGSILGGAATGAAFGAQFGVVGAAIGAVGGALLGLFGKAKKAREEMEKLRASFLQSQGGMAALTAKAKEAGVSLEAMFKAKSAAQLQAAIAAITAQLDVWTQAQDGVREAAERYGLTISELGPKFAQQELDKMALQLIKDYELLKASGAEMVAVIAKMGPEFAKYVDEVVKGGGTIPKAMKPVIDQLHAEGKLVHENGEAYTDAEVAALKYGETNSEMFQRQIDLIERMVAALERMAGINPTINIHTNYTSSGHPPKHGDDEGMPEFHSGGHTGFGSMPFPAMLRPRETVIPDENMPALLAQAASMGAAQAMAMMSHSGGGSGGGALYVDGHALGHWISGKTQPGGTIRVHPSAMNRGRGGF